MVEYLAIGGKPVMGSFVEEKEKGGDMVKIPTLGMELTERFKPQSLRVNAKPTPKKSPF